MINEEILKRLAPRAKIKWVKLPEDVFLNNFYQNHSDRELEILIKGENYTEVKLEEQIPLAINENEIQNDELEFLPVQKDFDHPEIQSIHEGKLLFETKHYNYYILGTVPRDFAFMGVTLMIEDKYSNQKERAKIDLYEKEETLRLVMSLGEVFNRSEDEFEVEVQELIDALEKYREKKIVKKKAKPKQTIKTEDLEKAKELLNDKDLIPRLNDLIGESGVVGEENTRLLLYIIASTYKMGYPLHALVQGTSGSGKSHLINSIGKSFPPEDMMSMTRVTSKSFYHYEDDQLVNKLMLIQDFDGLDEEAQYAFRELQSAGTISSSTVYKDRSGNITSKVKQVRSHFASLLATTKAEVYYDNMSRSLIIGVDESEEQTLRIIRHQNRKLAGLVDERKEVEARRTLQNLARALKPYEVINRYADKVQLPMEARMLRRLNSHYQAFVKQITILHQYQREKDDGGRLIATKEDLSMASEILFEAIMIKVDELDSSLRQFFNRMKEFVKSLSTKLGKPPYETVFTQREIRLGLNASKSSCFRYMEDLEQLEYIQKVGGYANRGFKYKIVYFDDMEKVKDKIKTRLKEQLASLGGSEPMEHQTPH